MSDPELELAQLLCTRLCHDLAGPVGAVAAGVELIGGDPTQADGETLGLIGSSSAAASAKLKFMRTALGASGGAGDAKMLLDGYIAATAGPGGKPQVIWPAAEALGAGARALGTQWTQVLLNLSLLALESLPSCRKLALKIAAGTDFIVAFESSGAPDRAAVIRAELIAAVNESDVRALSARTVHGHVAGRLVRAAGGKVTLAAAGNSITVTAVFPGAAA